MHVRFLRNGTAGLQTARRERARLAGATNCGRPEESPCCKATGMAPTSFADFARRTAAAWAVDEAR
jgi:hypothetical protein